MIDKVDCAWVAGILEGEGSFIGRQDRPGVIRVECQMTDKDVIETLQKICGGTFTRQTRSNTNYKPIFAWQIQGQPALDLIEVILPFMHSRRRGRIHELLEWHADIIQKRSEDRLNRDIMIEKAAREYIDGGISYRSLCKKYNLCKDTINRKVNSLRRSHGCRN